MAAIAVRVPTNARSAADFAVLAAMAGGGGSGAADVAGATGLWAMTSFQAGEDSAGAVCSNALLSGTTPSCATDEFVSGFREGV